MNYLKDAARKFVASAMQDFAKSRGVEIDADAVVAEDPPKREMGDVAFPLYGFAKAFRCAPNAIATDLAERVAENDFGDFEAAGPYLNLRLDRAKFAKSLLEKIEREGDDYGAFSADGKKFMTERHVMVEFSSPNTNKPLHLGHLRNDALGQSVSTILKFAGAETFNVSIINDRGVHICKSMLAYKKFHEAKGETPESLGVKSDRFVGDCYIEFEKYRKTCSDGSAEAEAQSMLRQWEAGDVEIRKLWKTMNGWALDGMMQTYKRTGVHFDKFYFESETYLKGKDEVLRGLETGVFKRKDDGSVWIDLAEIGLDEKIFMRSDGTTVYITQDLGTAIDRHTDWPFDQLVYVVGNEQIYHFKVLFYALKRLGYDWAKDLYHLAYGMVNLPHGRMKSREGTVVDADDLIDSLRDLAVSEIDAKGRREEIEDAKSVGEKIAIGALHYFLLSANPMKDMMFDPGESLSFNGNTGPYLQYTGARISAILAKAKEADVSDADADFSLLKGDEEWAVVQSLANFPDAVENAAKNLNPSEVAAFAYDLAKKFAVFYHECQILACEDKAVAAARLALTKNVLKVLKNAMRLILVPFLEKM